MKYTIIIEKLAEKFIIKLPRPEKERILKAIYQLPDGNDIKQLKGKKSKGMYRLRTGDYRVIYTILASNKFAPLRSQGIPVDP